MRLTIEVNISADPLSRGPTGEWQTMHGHPPSASFVHIAPLDAVAVRLHVPAFEVVTVYSALALKHARFDPTEQSAAELSRHIQTAMQQAIATGHPAASAPAGEGGGKQGEPS